MATEQNRQSKSSERDEARWNSGKEPRRPFPAFDFDKLPPPRADDPPYRPWWVLSDPYER
jgi:hypothetical protein